VDVAIEAGLLIDGSGKATPGRFVGVADGRVVTTSTTPLEAACTIDASAYTVMPGLIDTHVHLFDHFDVVDADIMARYMNDADGIAARLRQLLAHGITTVKSLCDPEDEVLEIRRRIAGGVLMGPRLLACGAGITAIGSHPAATMCCRNPYFRYISTTEVDTPDGARSAVRRLAGKGVDGVKLFYYGALPGEPPVIFPVAKYDLQAEITRFADPVLKAAIDEAHAHGLRVTVHVKNGRRAKTALECGVDTLEHTFKLDPEDDDFVELLARSRTSITATLARSRVRDEQIPTVKRLNECGIRIALGSDTTDVRGDWGLDSVREIEALHDAGLSTQDALASGMSVAAAHIGRAHDLGSLDPGKFADAIVLEGNPLEDRSALRRVALVIKGGTIVHDNLSYARPGVS